MKAKKVYEFINPKTDKYSLEDTIPLGPRALLLKRQEDFINKYIKDNTYEIYDNTLEIYSLDIPDHSIVEDFPFDKLVCNNLYLMRTKIKTQLPEIQGENIFFTDSDIKKLPTIIATRYLAINGTNINKLPDNIDVKMLFANDSLIYKRLGKEGLKEYIKDRGLKIGKLVDSKNE